MPAMAEMKSRCCSRARRTFPWRPTATERTTSSRRTVVAICSLARSSGYEVTRGTDGTRAQSRRRHCGYVCTIERIVCDDHKLNSGARPPYTSACQERQAVGASAPWRRDPGTAGAAPAIPRQGFVFAPERGGPFDTVTVRF
jgi:hypothetical protein